MVGRVYSVRLGRCLQIITVLLNNASCIQILIPRMNHEQK